MSSSLHRVNRSTGSGQQQQQQRNVVLSTSNGTGNSNSHGMNRNMNQKVVVTPAHAAENATSSFESESLRTRMTVDKNIVDELLLVCGVIGTTTTTKIAGSAEDTTQIVPVTDCLQWIQDLQRCLRRDDDLYRPISILLQSWNIVASKLLPLLLYAQYDTTMLITLCKIFVILTKPLHTQTIRAGRMILNTKQVSAG
jgi:hypothetical protein